MLVIRYLDLRYDEINRIVSKRHRVYISSYRISVSPLSLSFSPSFFPSFFDSQRLKPQSMHEDYVAYSQRDITAFPDYSLRRIYYAIE